jgi:hypothetical protein
VRIYSEAISVIEAERLGERFVTEILDFVKNC